MRVTDLTNFIIARHQIWTNRFKHKREKPWTDDPILQQYRFCNVYRELDTVTQWVAEKYRRYSGSNSFWFAMVMCRLINWPPTLEELWRPSMEWDAEEFIRVMSRRMKAGEKTWSSAYMIRSSGRAKHLYLAHEVLTPMWEARERLRPQYNDDSLAAFHARLCEMNGMGSFLAAQVAADVKYGSNCPLMKAPDWWTWAASGPGSRRGLNRVCGRDFKSPWKEDDWLSLLQALRDKVNPVIKKRGMQELHAQDLQNCLCEFDKYERVRLGEGRPRQNYKGV